MHLHRVSGLGRFAPLNRSQNLSMADPTWNCLGTKRIQTSHVPEGKVQLSNHTLITRHFRKPSMKGLVCAQYLFQAGGCVAFRRDDRSQLFYLLMARRLGQLFGRIALQKRAVVIQIHNVTHRNGRDHKSLTPNACQPMILHQPGAGFAHRRPAGSTSFRKVGFGKELPWRKLGGNEPIPQDPVHALDFAQLFCLGSRWFGHPKRILPVVCGIIQGMVQNPFAALLFCALMITPLPGQQPKPAIVPDRLPDSYMIYSLLMPGQVFADMDSGQGAPWAISATTINEDDMDPKLAPEATLQPPDDNPHAFREAVGDYNQRKKDRMVLRRRFQLSRTYVLLSPSAATDFRASKTSLNATSSQQAAYSNYLGITYFSEVYFNVAQTAALVYVLDWCGNLCSQAEWVYLEKHNGVWVRRSGKAPAQT